MTELINANPRVYDIVIENNNHLFCVDNDDADVREPISAMEVYGKLDQLSSLCSCLCSEHIRHLNDPEHPLTLEQLKVVSVISYLKHDMLILCSWITLKFARVIDWLR